MIISIKTSKKYRQLQKKSISNQIYEEVKKSLKSLADEEDQLIYKIGFYPNTMNKKSKMMKKSEQPVYEIDNELFATSEEDKSTFYGLFTLLLRNHFEQFKLDKIRNDKSMKSYIEVMKVNTKAKASQQDKSKKKDIAIPSFVRAINYFILLYIAVSTYKYFFEN